MSDPSFLDLNRQFMPFKDEKDWELQYTSLGQDGYWQAETWDKILSHSRVIILAEAGAGKTAELRAVNERIRDSDRGISFYVTLNSVAKDGLLNALETLDDQKNFADWEGGESDAHFFIDSLDEARLNGETFQKALSNIQKGLGEHRHRAKVFISCRVSDWRVLSDAADFKKYLGADTAFLTDQEITYSNPKDALLAPFFDKNKNESDNGLVDGDDKPSELHVVALAPLSLTQVKQLATWAGVEDPEALLAAIHSADASDLANRPQDLLSLVQQWKSNGTIGTKHSALTWAIQERLSETNLDLAGRDTLSVAVAYESAKLLAAQLTFGKHRLLSWPIEAGLATTTQMALNPREVLVKLTSKDVVRVINRAIFDPATVGAVRFHHRSAQELLCAEWLLDQIKNGCPIRKVWNLLTENKYGKLRFRPSLRPISSWLGQLDQRFFMRIVELEPHVLLEDGDPQLLSIESRRKLLWTFFKLNKGRDDSGISIDINQLARLASPELNDTMRELWQGSKKSGEVRDLILRMIWVGKLSGLSDIALEAAQARSRAYETSIASRALDEIGTEDDRRVFASHLLKYARTFPERAMDAAIKATFPSVLSLENLALIAERQPRQKRDSTHTGLQYGLEQIADRLAYAELEPFVVSLLPLLDRKPHLHRHEECISTRYSHLISPLLIALSRLVMDSPTGPVSAAIVQSIRKWMKATRYHSGYRAEESRKQLSAAIEKNPFVNKQLYDVRLEKSHNEKSDRWQFQRGFYGDPWGFNRNGFDLFMKSLQSETVGTKALCLLNSAFAIAEMDDNKDSLLAELRKVIAGRTELESELEVLENPPPRKLAKWERRQQKSARKSKRRRAAQEWKHKRSWIELRNKWQAGVEGLRTNASFVDAYNIHRWLRANQRYESTNHVNLDRFEFVFGPEVKAAAVEALSKSWRSYDPGNIARQNKSTDGCSVGRLCLEVEAIHDPKFFEKLTEEETGIVTRLAWTELNDVPRWAVDLWHHRVEICEELVREELRWDLGLKTGGKSVLHAFFKLERVPEPFRSELAKWTLEELQAEEPSNLGALRSAIRVITGAIKDYSNELAELAASRFQSLRRVQHKVLWLGVLIATDAKAGLIALAEWLASKKDQNVADQLMVELLATLFPDRGIGFGSAYQDYRQLEHLKVFLQLVYQHVRRSEDLEHDGCYSPGARDAAQDARNKLFGYLLEIEGEDTFQAILELSKSPAFEMSKERFEVLADERATADTDIQPWTSKEVLQFAADHEVKPTSLVGLHSLILDRLEDIKDEMEAGSFSNKQILRQDELERALERPVQLAVAQQLQLSKGTSYTLVREPEQEDMNEPDILLANAEVSEPVPLEIKVADSWTYAQLVEAIEGQLAGKYMKARDATHGILLLTFHDKKTYWKHITTKEKLEFRELERALQNHAIQFVGGQENIEKIDVIGISLAASKN